MFKFMIIFNKPANSEKFENSYNDLLALVERMPDITRRQVINVVGSPLGDSRIYRILEVYFDDQAKMEESLRSTSGQEAGGELSRFPAKSFELVFAEVYEEAGAKTETTVTTETPETKQPSESIEPTAPTETTETKD
jgi:uncharacterized protein (TIGR02118 family)